MQNLKGWLPAVAGMICLGFGPGLMAIYGFFVEPLSREFGVGAAILNFGPVLLLLVPGLLSPLAGRLADRLPIRTLILCGATLAMASLFAISRAPTLLLVAAGFTGFSLGMIFYGPVVVNGLMVKLYPGREARALAIVAIGISIAAAALPPVVGVMLDTYDWRVTLAALACGLVLLLWLGVLAAVPGGVVGDIPAGEGKASRDIYRQLPFWLIGLCVALALNVAIVLSVSYPPFFVSRGFTLAEAGWFLSLTGMAGLCGKAVLGWLGDRARAHARWLAVALLLLQASGITLLYLASGPGEVLPAMLLIGFGTGAFIPMHPYLNSCYFDATVIGQVNGAQMPLFLPFALLGAPLAGYVFDRTASYDLVLLALVAVLALAAVLAARLPGARLPAPIGRVP